jgi:hypothetical protein
MSLRGRRKHSVTTYRKKRTCPPLLLNLLLTLSRWLASKNPGLKLIYDLLDPLLQLVYRNSYCSFQAKVYGSSLLWAWPAQLSFASADNCLGYTTNPWNCYQPAAETFASQCLRRKWNQINREVGHCTMRWSRIIVLWSQSRHLVGPDKRLLLSLSRVQQRFRRAFFFCGEPRLHRWSKVKIRKKLWRSSDDQGVIQWVIQRMIIWDFSLLETCLKKYGGVRIHGNLQDIIILKKKELIQGLVKSKCKFKMSI